MIKSRKQQDIGNLCDLHTPLSDYDQSVVDMVLGRSQYKPVWNLAERHDYDSLDVKIMRQYHTWDRN